ncbi:MAG TPA: hypothetical protein VMT90_08360 [Dehalococcoidia bacterium]|jgi:hypothetical protein|nr:hypothetical protein [Dehalococcoidia bacterium]
MRYFPKRARTKQDIALLLKVCPNCLGDLVTRLDVSGVYYLCMQCSEAVHPQQKRPALPAPRVAVQPGESLSGPKPSLT